MAYFRDFMAWIYFQPTKPATIGSLGITLPFSPAALPSAFTTAVMGAKSATGRKRPPVTWQEPE